MVVNGNGKLKYSIFFLIMHLISFKSPKLKTGDAIEVEKVKYTVREVQKGIDALILEVSLQKT